MSEWQQMKGEVRFVFLIHYNTDAETNISEMILKLLHLNERCKDIQLHY